VRKRAWQPFAAAFTSQVDVAVIRQRDAFALRLVERSEIEVAELAQMSRQDVRGAKDEQRLDRKSVV